MNNCIMLPAIATQENIQDIYLVQGKSKYRVVVRVNGKIYERYERSTRQSSSFKPQLWSGIQMVIDSIRNSGFKGEIKLVTKMPK